MIIRARVRAGPGEAIRLAVSLLDCELDPAVTLATLYHQCWRIETVHNEIKTHQQGRPNGHATPIRAQLPRGASPPLIQLLSEIARERLLLPDHRCNQRVVKRKMSKQPLKNCHLRIRPRKKSPSLKRRKAP